MSTREHNIHEDLTLVRTLLDRWQTLGKPKLYTYSKDFFLLAISRWYSALVAMVLGSCIDLATVKQACHVFQPYDASALHEALDTMDASRTTALLVRLGRDDVVTNHGSDCTIEAESRDRDGQTPLLQAAADGHEGVVMLLREYVHLNEYSKGALSK